MERRLATLGLLLLLGVLGADLWVSYARVEPTPVVRPLALTPDDHVLNGYIGQDGGKWVAGLYGLIAHLVPGANQWQLVSSGTEEGLCAIAFAPDNLHGFAVGGGGTIVATSDGGRSWQPRRSGTREHLLDVYAASPSQACAVGAFGTVTVSADTGATWHAVKVPWDKLLSRFTKEYGVIEPSLNAVYFSSPRIGFAVGEFGTIVRTSDGGSTWQAQAYGTLDTPQLVGVAFLDERSGWALSQDGSVLKTTDSGKHWSGGSSSDLARGRLALRIENQDRPLWFLTARGARGSILDFGEGRPF